MDLHRASLTELQLLQTVSQRAHIYGGFTAFRLTASDRPDSYSYIAQTD